MALCRNSTESLFNKRKGTFFRHMSELPYCTEKFVENAGELFSLSILSVFNLGLNRCNGFMSFNMFL